MRFFISLLFILNIINAGSVDENYHNLSSLKSMEWLNKNLNNKNLIIIDVRNETLFKENHIKYAINIPAKKNLFSDKYLVPKLDFLTELFSKSGIDKKSEIIIYGAGKFKFSARLYWILELLGQKNVSILNVSYKNWIKNNYAITKDIRTSKRSEFIPRINNNIIKTKLDTLLAIGNKIIIDGREKEHYNGKKSLAKRFGHIPGAINYSCKLSYEENEEGSYIKTINELQETYKNIPKGEEIILYCGRGAESALNYLILRGLGYKVSIYDGSWQEWGNDASVPISLQIEK